MKLGRSGSGRKLLGSASFRRAGWVLPDSAKRELLARGTIGKATVLRVRGGRFTVEVRVASAEPYRTEVRDTFTEMERELMLPGDVLECRVDPGDRRRLILRPPRVSVDQSQLSQAKILADGRRGQATVLASTATGRNAPKNGWPILRFDLELTAWDEREPWRVRVKQPVPMSAVPMMALGQQLVVAFFSVDDGESVAVDWAASTLKQTTNG